MILSEILVPLLNANEPEARLVSIHVNDGQPVSPGIVLFTIETTKASTEVEAPKAGYFRLLAKEGDLFGVGQRLAVITDTPDERVQDIPSPAGQPEPAGAGGPPADLRITKPALALAQSLGVDLSGLPRTALVTEAVIRQHARQSYEP